MGMATTLMKAEQVGELAGLRNRLVAEQKRLASLLQQVEAVLAHAPAAAPTIVPPRPSPLDQVREVANATADLRVANGNLSADRVAKLFGVSLSQLAGWLGRTRQALNKTPDADSLQDALSYFERVARLRAVIRSDAEFRKWLRTPHELLDKAPPLELLAQGEWQVLADFVDDALTGAPT